MAAPNIVGPQTITAKTAALSSVTGATGTVLLNNAASSGKVLQVQSLYAANVDGASACEVTVKLHNQDDGAGTGRAICSTVSIPADATVIISDKSAGLWLEEDTSLVVTPSASDDLEFVCSYLEISSGSADPPQGWNISTATFSQSLSVSAQDTTPQDVAFSSDGSKMYVVGGSGVDINEYALSTPWDLSTASFSQAFSVSSQDSQPTAIAFKTDGSRMYLGGNDNDTVFEYSLSTAWDISTATYSQQKDIGAQEVGIAGIAFSSNGEKMFLLGNAGDDVNEYALATAWDVTSATYSQNFSVADKETVPHGLAFRGNGQQMYVTGSSSDSVHEYALSAAYDLSTAVFTQSFSVSAKDTAPYGVTFKTDGLKMYIVGNSSDSVHEYNVTA